MAIKAVPAHIIDFTRPELAWLDDGGRLLLDGSGIGDGYFCNHIDGSEVHEREYAIYVPDDPNGNHLVSHDTLEGWILTPDSCNNYHWYECVHDYITSRSQEWRAKQLDGNPAAEVWITFEELGYIDYETDPDIMQELRDIRSADDDFCYDTTTVTLARDRAALSKEST